MKTALTLLTILSATSTLAAETSTPLTYEVFEAAVSHSDLEECPDNLRQAGTFCRATLHHDEIHVFAFSEEGDSRLVGFASYALESFAARLK